MRMQIDALIRRIRETRNPSVIGLDTSIGYLPPDFAREHLPEQPLFEQMAEAVLQYNRALVDALWDIVAAVKVQVAYYELLGPAGMAAFASTLAYARSKGLLAIADVKRNDIGPTAAAYAQAYLGPEGQRGFEADFVTVTPYLGEDGIAPFAKACKDNGGGIFVLVKTSNPSSGQVQDVQAGERTVFELVGDLVGQWGLELMGTQGYSSVGAVVGATYPQQGAALRKRLPHTFFLVPGYGAQGATGADLAGCFDACGSGAIVNASRSILCAWKDRPGMAFAQAAREEALRMRDDICAGLKKAGKSIR